MAGRFLGDFQGLAGPSERVGGRVSQGKPQAVHGGTDSITLSVRPRSIVAGVRTLLRFVATAGGQPVARAEVRLAGRATRTDGRGQAGLLVKLARPGRYLAQASKRGYAGGTVSIRATRSTGRGGAGFLG